MGWDHPPSYSRYVTAEQLQAGDIVLKLEDGRLYLIGSEGRWFAPTRLQRFADWLRTLAR